MNKNKIKSYVLLTVARDGENIAAIVTFLYLYVSGCFLKKIENSNIDLFSHFALLLQNEK